MSKQVSEPGTVASAHVPVALGDGGADVQVPVLAVHVVGAGPAQRRLNYTTRISTNPHLES